MGAAWAEGWVKRAQRPSRLPVELYEPRLERSHSTGNLRISARGPIPMCESGFFSFWRLLL